MTSGTTIFNDWLAKVQPRVEYVRDAYLAYGVLEKLTRDAEDIVNDWQGKTATASDALAEEAHARLESAREVHQSYETAYAQVGIQMEIIRDELGKLQDERLTLGAMCQSLNIQELSSEVLEKAYVAIGPDTAVDNALETAKQAINELDAETKARQELRDFLAQP